MGIMLTLVMVLPCQQAHAGIFGIIKAILVKAITCEHKEDSLLASAVGRDWKGKLSLLLYAVAVGVAFVQPWIAGTLYVAAALIWLIPDRRITRVLKEQGERGE